VHQQGKTAYNTVGEVFPVLRCWEWYKTTGFKEIALIHGATERSYTKTATLINRIRHQRDGTPSTTLQYTAEQEGKYILEFLERKTTDILRRHGFSDEGRPGPERVTSPRTAAVVSPEEVACQIVACGLSEEEQAEVEQNPVLYERAADSVNISVDDVVVKKQKAERSSRHARDKAPTEDAEQLKPQEDDPRKYVHNTVAQLHHEDRSYTVTGQGVLVVLRIILGYLLNNELLAYRLQFFVDGQKTLQAAILRAFSWVKNLGLLLDWYHLEDKCKRQLRLAMKGKAIRHDVLHELTRCLWYGMVDKAITFLKGLQDTDMKDPDALRVLIGYIERNRPYIPCYEVRKRLGLRNSSNIGEKMNDLLVSSRQKHNGMSWSPGGSHSLAALEAIKRNEEYHTWLEKGELEFKWAA
jgi:hypothetical protein